MQLSLKKSIIRSILKIMQHKNYFSRSKLFTMHTALDFYDSQPPLKNPNSHPCPLTLDATTTSAIHPIFIASPSLQPIISDFRVPASWRPFPTHSNESFVCERGGERRRGNSREKFMSRHKKFFGLLWRIHFAKHGSLIYASSLCSKGRVQIGFLGFGARYVCFWNTVRGVV